MELKALVDYTRQLLQVERYADYCPNGLQLEGRANINKIVSGVTASMALLESAKNAGADAILVHHGYFGKMRTLQSLASSAIALNFCLKIISVCSLITFL